MLTPKSPRYDSTRRAWQDIWTQASVEVELEAVRYPRAWGTLLRYAAFLPRDGVILEAGSGLSAVVLTLREMGFNIMGLDYAENALHASHAYDRSLRLMAGDVHALPVASASLAGYLSFGVFEHFEHGMGGALAEAFRVLRPGGVLVLTIPYPNVVHQLVAWRRRRCGEGVLNDDAFYESTYTRAALAQAVTGAGFQIAHIEPTSHAFTLWGVGGAFRVPGYYRTSRLADALGLGLRVVLPWAFNFMTLVVARKPPAAGG